MSIDTYYYLLPEILLIVAATFIYVAGAFTLKRSIWSTIGATALVASAVVLVLLPNSAKSDGSLIFGPLSHSLRHAAIVIGVLMVMLSARTATQGQTAEFVGSLLMVVAGLMIVSMANDMVLLFLGLELISIPTYVLLYLGRAGMRAQESTIKYFFLSILSSAILLYGLSFLYGIGGSTRFTSLAEMLRNVPESNAAAMPTLLTIGVVLTFAGLSFKMAVVPFHFYAPDVYEGTSHGNAAILAVVPKLAGVIAILRISEATMPALGGGDGLGWRLLLILSVLTMSLGNLLALWQTNLRRLMAYSSIAHAGYMLIGLSLWFALRGQQADFDGAAAALFYAVVYSISTIGTFAAFTWFGSPAHPIETADDLAGLGRTRPVAAASLAAFMFSLAGIPVLAGFWGKFLLFGGAMTVPADVAEGSMLREWFLALALVGVLNAAVSAAYYLRIVGALYFGSSTSRAPCQGGVGAMAATIACGLGVIVLGLWPGPLMRSLSVPSVSTVEVIQASTDRATDGDVPSPRLVSSETGRVVSD